jgi:glycosyltransferase involved in cell wall biosynthesis
MRIAQVAPLYESCPPQLYGGTERVVSYLTEELVRLGHEVTLFASGDSQTSAVLEPCSERALWRDPRVKDTVVHHLIMLDRVRRRAHEFDIIHCHTEYLHLPFLAACWEKTLTTMHGRLDMPELSAIFREFPMMPLVSISTAQRAPLAWANWLGTVYHGLPRSLHRAGDGGGGYLAFLGRISPEKGPDKAIEIAQRANLPLQIAAKVDPPDRAYFEREVKPRLDNPLIEFVGEIAEADKSAFLGDAAALLFPIDWPEPFGLVLIEALANGTPVIAFGHGSVPEIIDDGITGFVVADIEEAVAAVDAARRLDRGRIREQFDRRFSVERMTQDYVTIYEGMLRGDVRNADADGETENAD